MNTEKTKTNESTFEKHFSKSGKFLAEILSHKPDYIVPVAKKGGKLLKLAAARFGIDLGPVRYKSYFELNDTNLKGKRIAIIDDATQFTATLFDYRRFFESKDAQVDTYSFVGHFDLSTGQRWKFDEQAEICSFLREPVYQEYILQQAIYLADNSSHFDLDHIVLRLPVEKEEFLSLLDRLRRIGLVLPTSSLHPQDSVSRFSLDALSFYSDPIFFSDTSVTTGPIRKIKLLYDWKKRSLSFSPMVFPTWQHKTSYLDFSSFQDVPFKLPFNVPKKIDPRNESLLKRTYQNLYFIYVAALAKSFLQRAISPINYSSCVIVRNDLDAFIGPHEARVVTDSMLTYITAEEPEQFREPQRLKLSSNKKLAFRAFTEVYDSLKQGYEEKISRAKNRVGVHHYLSYEHLFSAFKDTGELSTELDFYCDYGAIVPETIIQREFISRACRTGEPNLDLSWQRTQVLIPMAIMQLKKAAGKDPEAMVLNKVLSNFAYDFPTHSHSQLHCLIGKPFHFGTLVHASHRHRANSQPNIYSNEISPFYTWNKAEHCFEVRNNEKLISAISRLFSEDQETPYSEIVSYLRLLVAVWQRHGSVDILNMLSLCREQNHFYVHVRWNIEAWIEKFALYLEQRSLNPDERTSAPDIRILEECGLTCSSASEKLRLSAIFPERLNSLVAEFGSDLDFMKAVERIKRNTFMFTDDFRETQNKLREIVIKQRIMTNVALLVANPKREYLVALTSNLPRSEVQSMGFSQFADLGDRLLKIRKLDKKILISDAALLPEIQPELRSSYDDITARFDALPRPKKVDAGRIEGEARERARNLLTHLIYEHNLTSVTILFADLTGLRSIEEPKEDTVAQFYLVMEEAIANRGGSKLYGGKGGDDEYAILLRSPEHALSLAVDVKSDFKGNLFLQNLDVKFGLVYVRFSGLRKEEEAIRGWGEAKDCCTMKDPFRNRGDLLVSKVTLQSIAQDFPPLESEFIALTSGDEYSRFRKIGPK